MWRTTGERKQNRLLRIAPRDAMFLRGAHQLACGKFALTLYVKMAM